MSFPQTADLPVDLADELARYVASTLDATTRTETVRAYEYLVNEVSMCLAQAPLVATVDDGCDIEWAAAEAACHFDGGDDR